MGDMDYAPFPERLKEKNYEGFISVEWFGGEPWAAAEHEIAHLNESIAKV